jgi:tRNA G46 methylase TrmB
MKNESNNVWSTQNGPNKNLQKALDRYDINNYQRPIAQFSKDSFKKILAKVSDFGNNSIVLDICCGTGESSFNLSSLYPNNLIIGIDKSISRLERKNSFKSDLPKNVYFVRGEVLDLYYLFYQAVQHDQLKVVKQFILYPNPWPKEKHYKRRFSANPITPFIFQISSQIELRSNWKVYLEEFGLAAKYYGCKLTFLDVFTPEKTITAFEKKFFESNHPLYKCIVDVE